MATKKKGSSAKAWEIGGAITAAAIAAVAGAYMLADKKTKAKAKKWVVAARKEVVKNAKTATKLGAKEYGQIVDQAVKRYGSIGKMSAADIVAGAKELKGEWKKIEGEAKKMAKTYAPKKGAIKKTPAHKAKPKKKSRA
jgi:hypothetical protein